MLNTNHRATRYLTLATLAAVLILAAGLSADDQNGSGGSGPAFQFFPDPTGVFATFNTSGGYDLRNPFFQSLGTNGRACVTCHQPNDAWTITPPKLRARFDASGGRDPVFRTNDGSNCPSADVSSVDKRRTAYSLLLNKGLIRVGLPIPPNAEFGLAGVDDPYGCRINEISMYRRPLPATNLRFLSTVMWDGRETLPGQTILADLKHQAVDATLGHAQASTAPTDQQVQAIVDFETALHTAQLFDRSAGLLTNDGARGGPFSLSRQSFFIGINDPLGQNPTMAPFNPKAFDLYDAWMDPEARGRLESARQAVARGQAIFNSRQFPITKVGGLNDNLHQDTIIGTCTICHDSPNVGNHSVTAPLNIGISDASRRTPDLPLYTFTCFATGQAVQTTDPGRAMISGKCADIGKVKGPILRALPTRAPYFHNGSAATLDEVVEFYDSRFNIGLSRRDKSDLIAFLNTL